MNIKKLLIFATFSLVAFILPVSSVFAQSAVTGKIIVLDPGHGGSDSGAVNGSLREADVTWDIAQRLKTLLETDGARVHLTRDCDCDKSNNDRYSLANSVGGNALVSIHLNGSADSSKNGTMTLWGKKNKDLNFTKIMHQALYPSLGVPDLGVANFASGVLLKSGMPATIAETVFITNSNEYNLLTDGTGQRQQQIAQSLYNGLVNFFLQPPPPPKGRH